MPSRRTKTGLRDHHLRVFPHSIILAVLVLPCPWWRCVALWTGQTLPTLAGSSIPFAIRLISIPGFFVRSPRRVESENWVVQPGGERRAKFGDWFFSVRMGRVYYLVVQLRSARDLKNVKKGRKAQSPMVVFWKYPGGEAVLSRAAIHGGVNPMWNQNLILECEESCYATAMLTIGLYHLGKNGNHAFIGKVDNIYVSLLTTRLYDFEVFNEAGVHEGGVLDLFVQVVPPSQESIKVSVHQGEGLKNPKRWWQRLSFSSPILRKMRPYVVVEINLENEPLRVSPVAVKGGNNPDFHFDLIYKCNESLLVQDKLILTFKLYHRHKAEINSGSSESDRASDIIIGIVNIEVFQLVTQKNVENYAVHTLAGKYCGTLCVSGVKEPVEQQEQKLLIPSKRLSSWKPNIRKPENAFSKFTNCFKQSAPVVSAGAGVISAFAALSA